MAIQRQGNWLGSMRVDVPHLRLLEASVAGDFQVLSGTLMAGNRALVAHGACILDTGAVGSPASSLLLRMAGAILLHATASEPGTVFTVDTAQPDDVLSGTNANVVGSFTPGVSQVNYVSIDLVRVADPATQDAVVFRSAATGAEFTQVVPLGRILQYRIHISTSNFGATPSYCPIAKVTVDTSGNVESIVDCRQMLWRLGTGGNTPNALAQFTWTNRDEATSTSAFTGGDKDLASQSDFNRAIAQRLWELGGGEHWYAPATDRTVQLTYDNSVVFPATGENWQWTGTDLLWRGLSYWFANSTATENVVADAVIATPGLTDLADGELVYVELNRAANVTVNPVKATWGSLFALPESIPGSRHVLAWRQHGRVYVGQQNIVVNTGGTHATNTSFGTVKLFTAFTPTPANPVVPVMDADSAVALANPATQANVVARGITRDLPGALRLGTGANDIAVTIASSGVLTQVIGVLQIFQGTISYANDGVLGAAGVKGFGGALGGHGVSGGGTGAYAGVRGNAGSGVDAAGVEGVGSTDVGGGPGVSGFGSAAKSGVRGRGGSGGGNGVEGEGVGVGSGVLGTGGATDGAGVKGVGSTNGYGVWGTASGTGAAVRADNSGGGPCIQTNPTGTGPDMRWAGRSSYPGGVSASGWMYWDTTEKAPFCFDPDIGYNQMGDHLFMVSSDQTTNSDVMSDVTGMNFPVVSTKAYEFVAVLIVTTDDAAGFRIQFTGPTLGVGVLHISTMTIINTTALGASATAFSTAISPWTSTLTTPAAIVVRGSLRVGATSGTVQLQFANAVNAKTLTVKEGSYIRWRRYAQ